jgi:chromosome segregation ATPase
MAGLQKSVAALEATLAQRGDAVQQLQLSETNLKDKLREATGQLENIQTELKRQRAQNEELTSKSSQQTGAVTRLETERAALQGELDSTKKQAEAAQALLKQRTDQLSESQEQARKLQAELAGSTSVVRASARHLRAKSGLCDMTRLFPWADIVLRVHKQTEQLRREVAQHRETINTYESKSSGANATLISLQASGIPASPPPSLFRSAHTGCPRLHCLPIV